MNTSLTLSLNQLASLIGSFAFPDPDGDDSIVHGPGGPRVRAGVLAEIRRVTIAVIDWAERLGEQAMLSAQSEGEGSAGKSHNATAAAGKPRSANETADGQNGCATDDDCGNQTAGTKGKGPPGTAMAIIEPPIHQFVDDLAKGRPVSLPIPASSDPNPWKLSLGPETEHTFELLVAGAQFQFAVEATKLSGLSKLFQIAASKLIEQGVRRLGLEPQATALGAA